MRVNTDAGQVEGMDVGLGAVARNSEGQVLGCVVEQGCGDWRVDVVEAKRVYLRLLLAQQLGSEIVEVESHSLSVIQALRQQSSGSSELHLILDDVLKLASSFISVSWLSVKRSGNKVAHNLAHFQPMEAGKRWWVDDVPENIVSLARCDMII